MVVDVPGAVETGTPLFRLKFVEIDVIDYADGAGQEAWRFSKYRF